MPRLSEESKTQLLTDHYKDSFSLLVEARKTRDRFLVFVFGIVTLMLFQMFSPKSAEDAFGVFISRQLSGQVQTPQASIDVSFVSTLVWVVLLALVVKYFQAVIAVERQYTYIHGLEEILSKHFEPPAFTREGKAYREGAPLFGKITWHLYNTLLPILLGIVVIAKIVVTEILIQTQWSLLLAINLIAAVSTVIAISLFILFAHFRR